MKYLNTKMLPTLAAAEALAAKMGPGHASTQVYDGLATGFGVMRLRDRALFGAGGKMVPGTAW